MSELTILHNPRCSKSRQTLQLLQDKGLSPEIIEYLKTPIDKEQIKNIVELLGLSSAKDLMRKGEDAYKEQQLALEEDETKLIQAMVDTPKLIERPIVLANGKAAIGRPPEAVLAIL
ncbi:arsenate reductase (glutaredoxin) [Paraglaciecola sp. 2405UD69-4]|uniref:arsenate reductase (glutaredoxin) n=1 Tax=Paraglaciecola sp. 2405UD69-4 TaxID=3391836 RepID=UPI0039C9AB0E